MCIFIRPVVVAVAVVVVVVVVAVVVVVVVVVVVDMVVVVVVVVPVVPFFKRRTQNGPVSEKLTHIALICSSASASESININQ